jgi:hypothetical protein
VGQVACDQHLVELKLVQVTLQRGQHLGTVFKAPPPAPGQVAQGAL